MMSISSFMSTFPPPALLPGDSVALWLVMVLTGVLLCLGEENASNGPAMQPGQEDVAL